MKIYSRKRKGFKKVLKWGVVSLGIGCGLGFITTSAEGQLGGLLDLIPGIPSEVSSAINMVENIPSTVSSYANLLSNPLGAASSYIPSIPSIPSIPGLGSIPYVGGILGGAASLYESGWSPSFDMGMSNIAQMNTELPLLSAEKGFLGDQLNIQESDAIVAAQLARMPNPYSNIASALQQAQQPYYLTMMPIGYELTELSSLVSKDFGAPDENSLNNTIGVFDNVSRFLIAKEVDDEKKIKWGKTILEKVPSITRAAVQSKDSDNGGYQMNNNTYKKGALSSYVLFRWGVVCFTADRELSQKLLDASLSSAEITFGSKSLVFADWLDSCAVFSSLLGNTDRAEKYFKYALFIRKENAENGNEGNLTVDSSERLYRFYLSQYRFTKAEEYLNLFLDAYAKKISEQRTSHPNPQLYNPYSQTNGDVDQLENLLYAEGLANRGIIKFFNGKYYESLNDQKNAVEIIDRNVSAASSAANQKTDLSWVPLCRIALYDRLAQNYICQQKYDDAEEMLNKSIGLRNEMADSVKEGMKISLYGRTYDVFPATQNPSYKYYYKSEQGSYYLTQDQESQIQMPEPKPSGEVSKVPEKNILAAMYIKRARYDRENRSQWDDLLAKAIEQTSESMEMLNDAELGNTILAVETLRLQASAEKLLGNRESAIEDLLKAQHILVDELKAPEHFLNGSLASSLGELYYEDAQEDKALKSFELAEKIYVERGASHPSFIDLYYGQARVCYNKGDLAKAENLINKAIDYSCEARRYSSVDDQDRAVLFAEYYYLYETALNWMVEKEDWSEVFRLMEISRAQGFQDLMNISESALLARITADDPDKGAELKMKQNDALSALAAAKKALNKAMRENESEKVKADLRDKVVSAQQDVIAVSNEIKAACHTAGYIMDEEHRPADFAAVQKEMSESGLVVCEYFVGDESSWLLVYGKGVEPKAYPLKITAEQAGFLQKLDLGWNVKEGSLTADRLLHLLNNKNETGVLNAINQAQNESLEMISESDYATFYTQLHTLWELLLPDRDLRSYLLNGESEGIELLIIPDGVLAQLPFEMLVTEWDEYIRDVNKVSFLLNEESAPIFYAQSATVYSQTRKRALESDSERPSSVITAGDPNYRAKGNTENRGTIEIVSISDLSPLPNTKNEVNRIARLCKENGVDCTKLLESNATEKNVTREIDREYIHLACHGLVDYNSGNMFGALALTPISEDDPSDDGFFTLAEMLNLRLNSCELAVLSACNTNLGAVQQGEGTWSLGRGMALAGAKRVVTSDWSVSDDSTSLLMSVFIGNLLKDENSIDYAKALKDAKLYVRDQSNGNWTHPYYWAPFILLGNQ